eukprot:g7472.t2
MKAKGPRSSSDVTPGADSCGSGYLTPPKTGQGRVRGSSSGDGGVCSQRSGTSWPHRAAAGMPGEGWRERAAEGIGGSRGGGFEGGGGNKAGKTRGTKSPSAPLEGLHKSDGCFVTPKKISRPDFGGGVRIMGVSPSSHEPVRIAPMVRRCPSIEARHDDDDDDDDDDDFVHHAELRSAAACAAGSAEYSDHGGGGGGREASSFADDRSHDDTSGRGGGGSVSTSAADVFQRGRGAEFVVGQSREGLRAAACVGRSGGGRYYGDSGGAGRGLEAAAPRADDAGAEKERDAAELLSVGYDEWKEACTAEGKIYYYNRRTRVPRWTLPPTATYVPDPQRPAGYRIFALATTAVSVNRNTANATASSGSRSSSAYETAEGRACAARGTAAGKGSSTREGCARASGESRGGKGGDDKAEDSPPTALLLSTATPVTATMTTTGGTPSSPQCFQTGTAPSSSSTAAAEAKTATTPSAAERSGSAAAAPAGQRFVVHKSGLWASSSQPADPTSAAAAAATPPDPPTATETAPATLPTGTTTTDNNVNKTPAAKPHPETNSENAPPPVPQIGPGATIAPTKAAAFLAVGTLKKSVEPATPSAPQGTTVGSRRSDKPLADTAAPPAGQNAAAPTGLVGGDGAAELASEGFRPASTGPENAGDVVPPSLEAPERGGGSAGGAAASLVGSPSPAEAGPTPDSFNTVNGYETAMVTTTAAVEGDGSEAHATVAPPAGATPGSTAAVELDANLETNPFETPASRGVETEEVSTGTTVAATVSGTAVAEADEKRGSSCQSRPNEATASEDGSVEAANEHGGGGSSPSQSRSSSSLSSSSSSSTTLADFVHTVRAESGGQRQNDDSPAPSPDSATAAAAGVRERGVDGQCRARQGGTVLSEAVDRSGMSQETSKEEEKEEAVVFSSRRSPRTLRRQPLGPMRRSGDLEHSLPSRTNTSPCLSSDGERTGAEKGPPVAASASASRPATAAGTPATALAGLPVNQARSRFDSRLDESAAAAAAAADREDGKTVRLARGGSGFGGTRSSGLPGSSALRHREVRRQLLFSEDSEAKPLVFCPFCGEGIIRAGGLLAHLEVCYVLDRCRGGETHKQVEVAIRAISAETQKPGTPTPSGAAATGPTAVPQQAPPALLSQTGTSTGPENGRASEVPHVGGARPEAPGAGLEFSVVEGGGAGKEEERCEGCGRTFAPGRLQSHAKACRSVFLERRQPYDPRAMRAKGTPLEFFQQPIGASIPDADPPTSTSSKRGKKGDRGTTPASRRTGAAGLGGKKRSTAGGGKPVGQGTSAAKDGDTNRASPGSGISAGAVKPMREGGGGRPNSSGKATATATLEKLLPVVEGSAHCPFCSGSIPRSKLSAHLLRCKRLRSTQRAPKAELGSSCLSGTGAAETSTNGRGGDGFGNQATCKVRCPHCDRGFSPSVAPTHISICARVENRPRGTTNANAAHAPPQKVLDAALGVENMVGARRTQQEKARVMPPFY